MNSWRGWTIVFLVCVCSSAALAQKKICIGNTGGSDAETFNIQQSLYDSIKHEAGSRGSQVTLQLLTNSGEKQAKDEIKSLKCDYALMSNINREWPQPKATDSQGGGNTPTIGGSKDKDNPHPASTSRFHFALLDDKGKRIDKFDTSIEMQIRYTAKDVQPELKDILQEVANWTLDGTIASK
ncbi:MAG TPA: hypothetical protein VGL89_10430 [Candidatus Koribacter sp.]|jgi:hypothetical protein